VSRARACSREGFPPGKPARILFSLGKVWPRVKDKVSVTPCLDIDEYAVVRQTCGRVVRPAKGDADTPLCALKWRVVAPSAGDTLLVRVGHVGHVAIIIAADRACHLRADRYYFFFARAIGPLPCKDLLSFSARHILLVN
jgi:hypothetical protein